MTRTIRTTATTAMLALLALAAPAHAARSDDNPYCAMDQNTIDPATDLCNPLRYIPLLSVNALFCALYFAAALAFTYHQIRHPRSKYFLVLVIGTYCEAIGLALRISFRNDVHSLGGYIAMYMFVILSPCAFLAADYILLGRIVEYLDAARYLLLPPGKVSWTFVISDIVTFLIQASGGGISTSANLHSVGTNIFLAGLVLQLASFLLFSVLCAVFIIRVYKYDKALWNRPGWKGLYAALGWTCVMFLIRSVFRTVELSEGYSGYLSTHEVYYITLDALPLWLGIIVYAWFWPAKYLHFDDRGRRRGRGGVVRADEEEAEQATELNGAAGNGGSEFTLLNDKEGYK